MPGRGPCVPEKCPETGSGFVMGGPFWAGPLHNTPFVEGVLQDIQERIFCHADGIGGRESVCFGRGRKETWDERKGHRKKRKGRV